MSVDLKPLGPLELWSRPGAGEVAPWVRLVVAMAAMLAVMVVAASAAVLWEIDGDAVTLTTSVAANSWTSSTSSGEALLALDARRNTISFS